MAGTLTISTLSDGTNSTSSTNCISGSAKAWVNFNGTGTPAIRAGYNVSSITRVATGSYTVNFTNAFADTNYATQISTGYVVGANDWLADKEEIVANKTTSATRINLLNVGGAALIDMGSVCVSCFR